MAISLSIKRETCDNVASNIQNEMVVITTSISMRCIRQNISNFIPMLIVHSDMDIQPMLLHPMQQSKYFEDKTRSGHGLLGSRLTTTQFDSEFPQCAFSQRWDANILQPMWDKVCLSVSFHKINWKHQIYRARWVTLRCCSCRSIRIKYGSQCQCCHQNTRMVIHCVIWFQSLHTNTDEDAGKVADVQTRWYVVDIAVCMVEVPMQYANGYLTRWLLVQWLLHAMV